MTQEELQQLQTLLAKASFLLDLSEIDEISVFSDDDLNELVLFGRSSREGIYRTISSKGTDDEYM